MALITSDDIRKKARETIANGYRGKAIVAFIDLLGFSQEIILSWDKVQDADSHPLNRIIGLKEFVILARSKAKCFKLHDYDEKTVIARATYPDIITLSDSFIFIQKVGDKEEGDFISALLSITFNILELWRASIDKGFTLRGGLDLGELFYSDEEIIGPSFIEAVRLETSVADVSRIVYSNNIRKMIHDNYQSIPGILQDYILRYFRRDLDSQIILNPVMLTGPNEIDRRYDFLNKLQAMKNNVTNHRARSKYFDLMNRLYHNDRSKMNVRDFR